MLWTDSLLAAALSAFAVLILTLPIARIAARFGWVVSRSTNSLPVTTRPPTYTGGITVAAGMLIAACVFPALQWPVGLAAGCIVLLLAGLATDRGIAPTGLRWLAVVFAAMTTVASTYPLHETTAQVQPWLLDSAMPTAAFMLAGAALFHAIDRADGLADGLSLIAALALGIIAYMAVVDGARGTGIAPIAGMQLSFIGALLALAFYTWRRPGRRHAAVQLGSGGALMVGLIVGWLFWQILNRFGHDTIGPGTALWLVAIPLFDAGFFVLRQVFVSRARRADMPFRAVHLLQANQMSRGRAALFLLLAGALMAAAGIAAWRIQVPDVMAGAALLIVFAAYSLLAMVFWRKRPNITPGVWTADAEPAARSGTAGGPGAWASSAKNRLGS